MQGCTPDQLNQNLLGWSPALVLRNKNKLNSIGNDKVYSEGEKKKGSSAKSIQKNVLVSSNGLMASWITRFKSCLKK